ncbi:MAG: hypothetical protein L6Q78_09165 [Bacteroidia bacterium]|nr:hypothetical protein [Bacteroidia bacterium]
MSDNQNTNSLNLHWQAANYQENLLQSYRRLYYMLLSGQLIGACILAGLASMYHDSFHSFSIAILLFVLSLFSYFLIKRFQKLIQSRANDVNEAHIQLLLAEQSYPEPERIFTRFKCFQKAKGSAIELEKLTSLKPLSQEDIKALIQKEKGHSRMELDHKIPNYVVMFQMTLLLLVGLKILSEFAFN